MLPRLFEHKFPGLKVHTYNFNDPRLPENREACRAHALAERRIRQGPGELRLHTRGEQPLTHDTTVPSKFCPEDSGRMPCASCHIDGSLYPRWYPDPLSFIACFNEYSLTVSRIYVYYVAATLWYSASSSMLARYRSRKLSPVPQISLKRTVAHLRRPRQKASEFPSLYV